LKRNISKLIISSINPNLNLNQIQRVGQKIVSSINSTDAAVEVFDSLFEAGKFLLDLIPPETLNWRISKWFNAGTAIMKGKYSQITTPTLILVGKNDRLLPSQKEGKRLMKEMTGSEKVEVKEFDIGHALLEDDFIDFAEVIIKSEVFAAPKDELDVSFPTKADMEDVEKKVITSLSICIQFITDYCSEYAAINKCIGCIWNQGIDFYDN
jgi:hypothetical protein